MNQQINCIRAAALLLTLVLMLSCFTACKNEENPGTESSSELSSVVSSEISSEESSGTESSDEATSTPPTSSHPVTSTTSKAPTTGLKPPSASGIEPAPIVNIKAPNGTLYNKNGTKQNYVTPMDMEDNVFMDSLIYTGYNVAKQRKDGLMWQYILSAQKKRDPSKQYGWLSPISYDYDGGTSGYETNSQGLPDIKFFEKNDMVCASFIGYVYANYLPNVVGIDTSMLGKPSDFGWSNVLADSWYEVAKTWVKKGWSEFIKFDCRTVAGSGGMLRITPERSIPIGSIIVTANDSNADTDYAGHVSIYAGWKDGYNWVYHVGNDNGPEFCSIERMGYNPDPHYRQWLIAIITPPNIVRFAPTLEVTVTDTAGAPVQGATVTAKRASNGKTITIGTTGANGKISKDYLYYDDVTITVTAGGKTATATKKLTAENNSLNQVAVTLK